MAVGARSVTVMVTDAAGEEFPWPSLTTSEKTRVPEPEAVNVGFMLDGLLNVTVGPETWLQA
jgi:hypothetical protein